MGESATEPTELEAYRAAKDAFFRDEPDSPLLRSERPTFTGLAYYPEDPDLVFTVTPEAYEDIDVIEMGTSDGNIREYERWARVRFPVAGIEQSLTVFRDHDTGALFLPFVDAGAGVETYGAGRYLELPIEDGRLILDFNYAYRPFCAYNPGYSCPIPPAENRLSVHIRAGERLGADAAH